MHAERVLTRSSREYVCMKREVAPGLPILQLIWIFLALNVWGTIVKQFIHGEMGYDDHSKGQS